MTKIYKEPEEIMKGKLDRLKLGEGDVYDVLGYLIREYGLGTVTENLNHYLQDQTEQAFAQVENNDGGGFQGLAQARAFDVCLALSESLNDFAQKYEL